MLQIATGGNPAFCDGVSRRSFLTIGALGVGGLTLADLLRANAAAGTKSRDKAVINLYLGGEPFQHDMFDPKPEMPVIFRGRPSSLGMLRQSRKAPISSAQSKPAQSIRASQMKRRSDRRHLLSQRMVH